MPSKYYNNSKAKKNKSRKSTNGGKYGDGANDDDGITMVNLGEASFSFADTNILPCVPSTTVLMNEVDTKTKTNTNTKKTQNTNRDANNNNNNSIDSSTKLVTTIVVLTAIISMICSLYILLFNTSLFYYGDTNNNNGNDNSSSSSSSSNSSIIISSHYFNITSIAFIFPLFISPYVIYQRYHIQMLPSKFRLFLFIYYCVFLRYSMSLSLSLVFSCL